MTSESAKTDDTAKVDELRRGIQNTRKDMSETLNALEERFDPDALGEKARVELDHIEARLKSAMKEGLDEAKEAVTHGLREARQAVRAEVTEAVTHTKEAVREATLGRVETIATQAGDIMNDTRDTLVETIRRNPIPAALAGVGIAWLLMNRSTAQRRRGTGDGGYRSYGPANESYGRGRGFAEEFGRKVVGAEHALAESAGHAAHRVGDTVAHAGTAVAGAARDAGRAAMGGVDAVTHMAHDARDAAGKAMHAATLASAQIGHGAIDAADHMMHQAREAAAQAAQAAQREAAHVESSVATAWEANPLAFGAAAVLAGAAMGYALPRTQKEDALVGDLRNRVVHQATDMASHAVQSLEHMAEDAGKAAKDAVVGGAHA